MQPGSPTAPVLDDGRRDPDAADLGLGAVRRHPHRAAVRHPAGPAGRSSRSTRRASRARAPRASTTRSSTGSRPTRTPSLVNDATLGQEPTRDLRRVLQRPAEDLRGAGGERGRAEGPGHQPQRDRRRVRPRGRGARAHRARPARHAARGPPGAVLAQRRAALAAPRSRSTPCPACAPRPATLDASTPFIDQARQLFRRSELRGAAKVLRGYTPTLVRLNQLTIPVLDQGRAPVGLHLATCWCPSPGRADPACPSCRQINNQPFFKQAPRGLVGLSGESRLSDGNLSYFHGQAVAPPVPGQPVQPPQRQRDPARARRPTAAAPRRRTVPTCPVRSRSRRT